MMQRREICTVIQYRRILSYLQAPHRLSIV